VKPTNPHSIFGLAEPNKSAVVEVCQTTHTLGLAEPNKSALSISSTTDGRCNRLGAVYGDPSAEFPPYRRQYLKLGGLTAPSAEHIHSNLVETRTEIHDDHMGRMVLTAESAPWRTDPSNGMRGVHQAKSGCQTRRSHERLPQVATKQDTQILVFDVDVQGSWCSRDGAADTHLTL